MHRLWRAHLTACAMLLVPVAGGAQETTFLFGRVVGSEQAGVIPSDWDVSVSAVLQGTGPLSDSPRHSQRELFAYRVPQNATVRLIFAALPFYELKTTPWVTVNTEHRYAYRVLPDITLSKIVVPTTPSGTPHVVKGALRKHLQDQRELAKAAGATQIFQWNLEIYQHEYRDLPDARAEIEQFKADADTKALFSPEQSQRGELYRLIIARNQGEPASLPPAALLPLLRDRKLFAGIRAEVVRAFTGLELPSDVKDQALSFFREQSADPMAELFLPTLTALARIGNAADKETIMAGVRSVDPQRALASIAAIGEAGMKEGGTALSQIADGDADPQVKSEAIRSLGRLRDDAAIATLTRALGEASVSSIRVEAAKALGNLTNLTPDARRLLQRAATKDLSAEVRAAAAGSLGRR